MYVIFSDDLMILLILILAVKSEDSTKDVQFEDDNEKCDAKLLPKKSGTEWICEKDPPTLGTICRMECLEDKVVARETLRVCTPNGWTGSTVLRFKENLPSCLANPCADLKQKQINHGKWSCTSQNSSKTCNNHRVGEICHLKCEEPASPHLGHLSVCTDEGWVPDAEDMRCYGCQVPANPEHGKWNCDSERGGSTVCLLQCNKGHTGKGPHTVECSKKDGDFQPSPKSAACVAGPKDHDEFKELPKIPLTTGENEPGIPLTNGETEIPTKNINPRGRSEGRSLETSLDGNPRKTLVEDPIGSGSYIPGLRSNEPSAPQDNEVEEGESCPSSPAKPPPNGRWICDESTKQAEGSCRLECDKGFFTPQPVTVSCGGEANWCTQSPGVACLRKDTCTEPQTGTKNSDVADQEEEQEKDQGGGPDESPKEGQPEDQEKGQQEEEQDVEEEGQLDGQEKGQQEDENEDEGEGQPEGQEKGPEDEQDEVLENGQETGKEEGQDDDAPEEGQEEVDEISNGQVKPQGELQDDEIPEEGPNTGEEEGQDGQGAAQEEFQDDELPEEEEGLKEDQDGKEGERKEFQEKILPEDKENGEGEPQEELQDDELPDESPSKGAEEGQDGPGEAQEELQDDELPEEGLSKGQKDGQDDKEGAQVEGQEESANNESEVIEGNNSPGTGANKNAKNIFKSGSVDELGNNTKNTAVTNKKGSEAIPETDEDGFENYPSYNDKDYPKESAGNKSSKTTESDAEDSEGLDGGSADDSVDESANDMEGGEINTDIEEEEDGDLKENGSVNNDSKTTNETSTAEDVETAEGEKATNSSSTAKSGGDNGDGEWNDNDLVSDLYDSNEQETAGGQKENLEETNSESSDKSLANSESSNKSEGNSTTKETESSSNSSIKSASCSEHPWEMKEHGEWHCTPPKPPYLMCRVLCSDVDETYYQATDTTFSFTCNTKATSNKWNVTKEVSCEACHVKSESAGQNRCNCRPGFAGNGFFCGKDSDFDGIPDEALNCTEKQCKADNCIDKPNSSQMDVDKDGQGNDCDIDMDNDGIFLKPNPKCSGKRAGKALANFEICLDKLKCPHDGKATKEFHECFITDNCNEVSNKDQKDTDKDTIGDVCDNCVDVSNFSQEDTDKDGKGDECDTDIDNDGIENEEDNCKLIVNKDQKDTDNDGFGDVCDNCPTVANKKQEDVNQNFIGDSCETGEDKDGDGFFGKGDNCEDTYNANQQDIDDDGIGDLCDDDADGDGIPNKSDNCPLVANKNQETNYNHDTTRGRACESDFDGDGVSDMRDICPENPDITTTNFGNLDTMDLCEKEKQIKKTGANSCAKPEPAWEYRDEGREIYQGRNSRVSIAVSRSLYGDVDFNGTIYVANADDNDWVGIVWGMMDINSFYMLVSNRQKNKKLKPLYWNIRKIEVSPENRNATNKFDKMIRAIKQPQSVPGYSKVLWTDPKEQQWKAKKSVRWVVQHKIAEGEIKLEMYEGGEQIIKITEKVEKMQGGRLGVFCMSQEKITWSAMSLGCPASHFMKSPARW